MRVVGRVAREQAAAAGVPLEIYDARRDPIRRAEASQRGFELDVVVGGCSPCGNEFVVRASARKTVLRGVTFPMLGRHQLDNLRAALMALEAFARLEGRAVDPKGVRRGIEACRVPGRLEVARWEPPVLLDGAHCPLSARAAAQACAEHFPGRDMILVLGMMADKKIEAILSNLRRFGGAAQVFAYTAPNPRACGEEKLARLARRHFPWVETCGTMEKALEHALAAQSRRPGALVLCTGTFYGIAQARRYLVSHGRTPTNTDKQG
jgi:dihydrofolate synthase/folylpolyglutamate synthase